jgi:hypothetical protein
LTVYGSTNKTMMYSLVPVFNSCVLPVLIYDCECLNLYVS